MINPADFLKWCQVFGIPTGGGGGGGVTSAQVQQFAFNFKPATGVDDAFIALLSPAVITLTDGFVVTMSSGALQNLTTTPTLQISALAPVPIELWAGQVAPGDIQTNASYIFIYNLADNVFKLINPSITTADAFLTQANTYNAVLDSGAADAYVVTLTPEPQGAFTVGFPIYMQVGAGNTNTGDSTLTVNGAAAPIYNPDGTLLASGAIVAGSTAWLLYSANLAGWVLMNTALFAGATPTQVQQSAFNFAPNSGTGDAVVVNLDPPIAALTDGLEVTTIVGAGNTIAAPTLQVNATAAITIKLTDQQPLLPGDLGSTPQTFRYSQLTGCFVLMNPQYSNANAVQVATSQYITLVDQGAPNALAAPMLFSSIDPLVVGAIYSLIIASGNTNTGACTLSINSGAALPVILNDGSALTGGEIVQNQNYLIAVDRTNSNYVLLNPTLPPTFSWVAVSGTTQACASNTGYITNNAAQTTYTAPATMAVGDEIIIKGVGAGGWIMTANTGQTIRMGTGVTTSGGTVTSQDGHDSFKMTCIVADTTWSIDYAVSAGLNFA